MKVIGILGALWATLGTFALIGSAIWRLSFRTLEALESGLGIFQWTTLGGWIVFMAYCEGYKGFQKSFSRRTAARTHHLITSPNLLNALLAPLFVMGYFHADRRTKIVAYTLTFGIAILVLFIRYLPQPWRGIVDAGVVVGLSWGLISLAIFIARALASGKTDTSPCVPDPAR